MSFRLVIAKEKDDKSWRADKIDYLPFGVKTLKVSVAGDYIGKIRLRPKRFAFESGELFAYDDTSDPPQFIVSWGGGHEQYYELNYPDEKIVHFLVHHAGQALGDHILTIEAENEQGQIDSLPVSLTYPRVQDTAIPVQSIIKPLWEEKEKGLQGSCVIRLEGKYTPRYISRWWPQNRVEYKLDKQPPKIYLKFLRLSAGDKLNGDITIYNEAHKQLAVIRGSISYPLYDMRQVVPELYYFGPNSWALRVWFFWLDLDLSKEDLSKYWSRDDTELDQVMKGITNIASGGYAKKNWGEEHEIPDAERVDLVFDDNLNPLYAGVDLHWREIWGNYTPKNTGDPLQVQIMNTELQKIAQNWKVAKNIVEGWTPILRDHFFSKKLSPYKPYKEVMKELQKQGILGADPIAMQSHTPGLFNVKLGGHLTSTDVRHG